MEGASFMEAELLASMVSLHVEFEATFDSFTEQQDHLLKEDQLNKDLGKGLLNGDLLNKNQQKEDQQEIMSTPKRSTPKRSSIIPGLEYKALPPLTPSKSSKTPPPQKQPLPKLSMQKSSTQRSKTKKYSILTKADLDARFNKFIAEPLTGKGLSAIPGLGAVFEEAFMSYNKLGYDQQYTKVTHLLAQFLVLDCNEVAFKSWLRHEIRVPNTTLINTCYVSLREWWHLHNVQL